MDVSRRSQHLSFTYTRLPVIEELKYSGCIILPWRGGKSARFRGPRPQGTAANSTTWAQRRAPRLFELGKFFSD